MKKLIIMAALAVAAFGFTQASAQKVIKSGNAVYIDMQGMPTSTFSTTTLNKSHNSSSVGNSVFRRIEINRSDSGSANWNDAKTFCSNNGAGWRLPTQRELQLMYAMKDLLAQAGITNFLQEKYSTLTEDVSVTIYSVNFSNGQTIDTYKSDVIRIRCVREV